MESVVIYVLPTIITLHICIYLNRWDIILCIVVNIIFLSMKFYHSNMNNNNKLKFIENVCLHTISPITFQYLYCIYKSKMISNTSLAMNIVIYVIQQDNYSNKKEYLYLISVAKFICIFLITHILKVSFLYVTTLLLLLCFIQNFYQLTQYELYISALTTMYILEDFFININDTINYNTNQQLLFSSLSNNYDLKTCVFVSEFCFIIVLILFFSTEISINIIKNYLSINQLNLIKLRLFLLICTLSVIIIIIQPQEIISLFDWIIHFIIKNDVINKYNELIITIYWVMIIIITIYIAYYSAVYLKWPTTCIRKIFHFLIVILFIPAMFPTMLIVQIINPTNELLLQFIRDNNENHLLNYLIFCIAIAFIIFVSIEYIRLLLLSTSTTLHHNHNILSRIRCNIDYYMSLFLHSITISQYNNTNINNNDDNNNLIIIVNGFQSAHISLLIGCGSTICLSSIFITIFNHNNYESTNTTHTLTSNPYYYQCQYNHHYHDNNQDKYQYNRSKELLLFSLFPYLGLITIGIGDAFAAIIGSIYGKSKWNRSFINKKGILEYSRTNRTYIGSIACFLSMCVSSLYIILIHHYYYQYHLISYYSIKINDIIQISIIICITMLLTTLLEAYTQENDNIILPLYAIIMYLSISAYYVM